MNPFHPTFVITPLIMLVICGCALTDEQVSAGGQEEMLSTSPSANMPLFEPESIYFRYTTFPSGKSLTNYRIDVRLVDENSNGIPNQTVQWQPLANLQVAEVITVTDDKGWSTNSVETSPGSNDDYELLVRHEGPTEDLSTSIYLPPLPNKPAGLAWTDSLGLGSTLCDGTASSTTKINDLIWFRLTSENKLPIGGEWIEFSSIGPVSLRVNADLTDNLGLVANLIQLQPVSLPELATVYAIAANGSLVAACTFSVTP